MIELKKVDKNFAKTKAVRQVSFKVEEGQNLVLIGTSGSGKTTTLKMINRLIEPSAGEIFLARENILQEKPEIIRRKIGYVIQNVGLFPHYTIAQNIAIVPKLLSWKKNKIEERSRELLEMLGLPENFLKRFPQELSGGQKQRVGIARALAADPPLLLMDEPFGALDPITKSQIQEEFLNLENQWKKTVVIVTHDIFEAVTLGNVICLMNKGEIQQIGSPKELLLNPQNEFVKNFFDAQRFELSLKLTKVKELIDLIPNMQSIENQKLKLVQISENQSLLDVLKNSSQALNQNIYFEILDKKNNHIIKKVSRARLLETFYQRNI